MATSSEYVALIKARHNLQSDYAVGKFLKVTHTTVGNWVLGRSMSEQHARAVAHALDIPEAVVLMDVTAEKARTDEAKALYQGIADALRETPSKNLPPALRRMLDDTLYIMLSQNQKQKQLIIPFPRVKRPARAHLRLAS